ncbi:MAG: hypothetical protein CMJ54_00340 [Planctomycetaceae bacterium]|nr:hypothetical protein [Planctomycetaceae bacterium]
MKNSMMRRRPEIHILTVAFVACTTAGSATAGVISAIDNTADGTNNAAQAWKSLTATNWTYISFTVGTRDVTISSMKMAMFASSGNAGSYDLTWELYATDGLDELSGSALATDTQSEYIDAPSSNVDYYDFTTGGTLGAYTMQAGTTYALLFKSNAGSTLSWTRTGGNHAYDTSSSEFSVDAIRRTTNSGGTYSLLSDFNYGWQMNVETAGSSVVPGLGGMATIAGVGLLGRRRRR